jgi:sarcosine oxidase subunit delta
MPKRPDPAAENAAELFYRYVYLRENPAGQIQELWYHASGCRSWLIAVRDTRTHEFAGAKLATETAP